MGQLLADLETNENIKQDGDFLGGFDPFETNIYDFTVKLAYLSESKGKAKAVNITLEHEDGRELRQQFWITSGEAKGCKPYFINKNTGEKKYLPGYTMAEHLSLLTAAKRLPKLTTEKRTIKLYDPQEKKEMPKEVDMFIQMVDKKVSAGVIKQIVDKRAANDAGEYVATGETRIENEVDKFFRASDGMTVTEVVAKAESADFKERWINKWAGQVKDKSTPATGNVGAPQMNAGAMSNNSASPEALFA
jgi:hypothetical protein